MGRGPAALPSRDWSPSPAKEARRARGAGSCSAAAEAEAVRAPRLPAATWEPRECTPAVTRALGKGPPAVTREPRARAYGPRTVPRAHPQGHLGAPRAGGRTPPRPQPAARPSPPLPAGAEAQPGPAHPSSRATLRPPRRDRGCCGREHGNLPAVTSGCPQAGAEAAAAERALPAPPMVSRSVGPRVEGWTGRSPCAACPEDARRRREARAHTWALRPRHGWHEATQCVPQPGILQMPVVSVPGHETTSQGCACTTCAL